MLYVYYGSDVATVADRASALVAQLRAKRPDAEFFVFEGDVLDPAPLDALVEARGLFVEKHIVVLKGVCEKAESRESIFARLPQFAASENIFILREGTLHAAHKKILQEHAEKCEEHVRAAAPQRTFDQFGLVSALKARDRRRLWVAYLEARRAGESPEGVAGLLHWGIKDMVKNANRYRSSYAARELHTLSRSLIACYHDAHRGGVVLDVALERWALSL